MKKLFLLTFILVIAAFNLKAQPTIQWQKSLGGTGIDDLKSIQQTNDSGYIVAGASNSNDGDVTGNHGDFDFWLVKLNSVGDTLWQKCLGGTGTESAWAVNQTNDSGYIVAGAASSYDGDVTGIHGGYDFWVVKLNSTGDTLWQKSLGGSWTDYAYSIQQTSDSGYIVAGSSDSNDGDVTGNHGSDDFWVVKLNSNGDTLWQKSLGGTGGERAYAIKQTNDGGYIVVGASNSNDGDVTGNHGGVDCWIVKLNNTGIIQWQKSLGGTGSDGAYSVIQTKDSGYVVAGASNSNDGDVTGNHGDFDFWVVKLNSTGDTLWQKSLGGTGYNVANNIQQTNDNGYIVAGESSAYVGEIPCSNGAHDFWLVKLNASGITQWQKCLGGTSVEFAEAIQQTNDSGYIVAGLSSSNDIDVTGNHGGEDFWVVKLNSFISSVYEIDISKFDIQITPNPISSSSLISFSLAQSENVSINVFDITGRMIKTIFKGELNPGNHQLDLNINKNDVDAGVYLLTFNSSSFSKSVKLVVAE